MHPFHKRSLNDWFSALKSKREGEILIEELIENCGIEEVEESFVYRCRWNLSAEEIFSDNFDAPPLKIQRKTKNRFQPKSINCLYASYSESVAVLEVLSMAVELQDVFYTAKLKVEKELKLLDLTNNIGGMLKSGNREWDYRPVFGPMFFVDDQLGYTNIIETTQLMSELTYKHGFDGIIYLSRSHYLAKLKQGEYSFPRNYVIYGSPIRDGKLSFDSAFVQSHGVKKIM